MPGLIAVIFLLIITLTLSQHPPSVTDSLPDAPPQAAAPQVAAADQPPSAPSPTTAEMLKTDAETLWSGFRDAVAECDAAGDQAKASLKGEDVVAAYSAFNAAKDACLPTSTQIDKLQPPANATDTVQAEFKTALSDCSTAYAAKWSVYRRMTKILDGDGRPSSVADVEQTMDIANASMASCVPTLMRLVHDAGGAVPELDDAPAKR